MNDEERRCTKCGGWEMDKEVAEGRNSLEIFLLRLAVFFLVLGVLLLTIGVV